MPPRGGHAPGAALASPVVEPLARFELGGHACRIVCVDDQLPTHQAARGQERPRLVYAEHEVAHFQLDGHRYALLEDPPALPADAPVNEFDGVPGDDVFAVLTNRELQIVQLICMGALTKQVADRLRLSEFTVRSYLKTIYCKLGVRSRGAMVYAYAQSLARSGTK